MANPSTSQIVSRFLEHVASSFRMIRDVEGFQEVLPYRTVVVIDEASASPIPLSKEYTEHRLYMMDGPTQLGTIDIAFHEEKGLVNASMFLIPREWLKRRAVINCLRSSVIPFVRENYPNAAMIPVTSNNYLFPDPESGLTFQARPYLDTGPFLGIGVAVTDSDHA